MNACHVILHIVDPRPLRAVARSLERETVPHVTLMRHLAVAMAPAHDLASTIYQAWAAAPHGPAKTLTPSQKTENDTN